MCYERTNTDMKEMVTVKYNPKCEKEICLLAIGSVGKHNNSDSHDEEAVTYPETQRNITAFTQVDTMEEAEASAIQ